MSDYAKSAAAARFIYDANLAYEERKARIGDFFQTIEDQLRVEIRKASAELRKQGMPGIVNFESLKKKRIEFTLAATKRKCVIFLVASSPPRPSAFINVKLEGSSTHQTWNVNFEMENGELKGVKSGFGDEVRKEEVTASRIAQLAVEGLLSDHFE